MRALAALAVATALLYAPAAHACPRTPIALHGVIKPTPKKPPVWTIPPKPGPRQVPR